MSARNRLALAGGLFGAFMAFMNYPAGAPLSASIIANILAQVFGAAAGAWLLGWLFMPGHKKIP